MQTKTTTPKTAKTSAKRNTKPSKPVAEKLETFPQDVPAEDAKPIPAAASNSHGVFASLFGGAFVVLLVLASIVFIGLSERHSEDLLIRRNNAATIRNLEYQVANAQIQLQLKEDEILKMKKRICVPEISMPKMPDWKI